MDVELRVRRFNPEQDEAPHWETYHIDAEPTDRVLDLLHQVKWYQDGTLTFRRSCAHGVCGSDAMVINGRNRLACESLVQDLGSTITVEALKAVPLVKDLLVDMDGFMDKYKQVMPFLVNDEPLPEDGKERRQSQAERERYDDTTKCILCAACTTACPVFWTNPAYVGPAAIVNAHRFIMDSRDQAHEERLEIMADADGVWRCRTIFNCVEACPRGINVTGAIMEVIGEIQKAGASS
jgi:succinate dehydrogenase / fumarate reductase, iron-sulfur subunit